MKSFPATLLTALGLTLAACGGGGGEVASAPPPLPPPAPAANPTPPPVKLTSTDVVKTPLSGADYAGLVAGTSNTMALSYERGPGATSGAFGPETVKVLSPSALRLTIEPVGKTYTLEFALPGYPAKEIYDLGHQPDGFFNAAGTRPSTWGNRVITTYRYSDGTSSTVDETLTSQGMGQTPTDNGQGQLEMSSLHMNLGLRYVTYGTWTHDFRKKVSPTAFEVSETDARNQVFFVTGRRTGAGEIPTSGKAAYSIIFSGTTAAGAKIGLGSTVVALNADFASRLIAASIDAQQEFFDDALSSSGWWWGAKLSGSAPIASTGDFQIGLTGSATLTADASNTGVAQSKAMTGSVLGALFGPGAEETGGLLQLNVDGAPLVFGSFVGARQGS